jgi:zinc transport system substrate-binding protein
MMLRLCLISALLIPGVGGAEPLRVFVSVLPQKTFVEKVGGDQVEVRALVRPGHSPATYDPTPEQISALASARLYVRTGVPFENAWMERILSANPALQVLDAREGIDMRTFAEGEHSHGDSKSGELELDPHIWTSPPLVARMARNIRDALTELDPQHGEEYSRNLDAFSRELAALDSEIRTLLANAKSRWYMVYHPAWGYFAETYGLTQVPIENEGKEPGARRIAVLIDQARREGIRVIFVQPQFNRRSAEQIAHAIGGRVVAIDPLSPDYVDNLREVARRIAEAGDG